MSFLFRAIRKFSKKEKIIPFTPSSPNQVQRQSKVGSQHYNTSKLGTLSLKKIEKRNVEIIN